MSIISDVRDAMLLDTSTGSELTKLGANYGVSRPSLDPSNDVLMRCIVAVMAWQPKAIHRTVHAMAECVFGTQAEAVAAHGRAWKFFEVNPRELILEAPLGLVNTTNANASYFHGYYSASAYPQPGASQFLSKQLDGANEWGTITDASQTGLDVTGDITLECWVRFDDPTTGSQELISKWNTAGSFSYRLYWSPSTDQIIFTLSNNGTTSFAASASTSLQANTWYHVAATWDSTSKEAIVYLDGIAILTTTLSIVSIFNSTADFRVGAQSDGSNDLAGFLDDVRVWNTVRTPAQILANKDVELSGAESNLQGYWRLNGDFTDETVNGNTLSAGGTPVDSVEYGAASLQNTSTLIVPGDATKAATLATNATVYWREPGGSWTGTAVTAWTYNSGTDQTTITLASAVVPLKKRFLEVYIDVADANSYEGDYLAPDALEDAEDVTTLERDRRVYLSGLGVIDIFKEYAELLLALGVQLRVELV